MECEFKYSECKRLSFCSSFFPFFFFLSQDGKTAEDLAYADQHEPIFSLLGKLKKVKA